MERFVDKNLNVTSKHIFLFFCCGRHSKGKGRNGFGVREALKGLRERRKGKAFLSSLLPRERSRA